MARKPSRSKARLQHEMFIQLPPERDVISYSDAVDKEGKVYLLKFVLRDDRQETIHIPPAVTFHIRRSIKRAIKRLKWLDPRNDISPQNPKYDVLSAFIQKQPDFEDSDWIDNADTEPNLAIGCEVHAYKDMLFLGFQVSELSYKILKIDPCLSG